MENTIKDIEKSLTILERWEKLSNQALEAWEADPLNEEREKELDKLYKIEFNEFVRAAHLLSQFSGIDEKTARRMIKTERAQILAILEKSA